MKDSLGNAVNPGDILLETGRGGSNISGECRYSLLLWEMPDIDDGHGYHYSIDGHRSLFAWTHLMNSTKLDMDKMPEGFEFSFKHGMDHLDTPLIKGTVDELIQSSNWKDKSIPQVEVDKYNHLKTLKIETLSDIIENIDTLSEQGYVPCEVMTNVLNVLHNGRTPVNNGEIGIAALYDSFNYAHSIGHISLNIDLYKQLINEA